MLLDGTSCSNPAAQLNVRETFEFSARCQGVGLKAANLRALLQAEEEKGAHMSHCHMGWLGGC